jgi:hypothetical protein
MNEYEESFATCYFMGGTIVKHQHLLFLFRVVLLGRFTPSQYLDFRLYGLRTTIIG